MLCKLSMSSKADYLKKYLSSGDTVEPKKESKRRRKIKKRANLAIHDDDVDWRSLVPQDQPESEEEDGEDEAPQVAEFKDDSIRKVVQWQPVDSGRALSEDDDLSPPRLPGGRRLDSPDLSPPRREKRRDSDNDLSPPRKRRPRADRGTMIRARKRHDSPQLIESGPSAHRREDLSHHSPPRRKRHDSDVNSPPRRKRHDSDDNSPPRRKRHDSDDNSPPRRKRHDSDDNSPPRRKRHDSDVNSPPRRKRHDSDDNSPPRRKRHDSDDNSPPRRKRHNLSPPRKADRDQRSPDHSLSRKSDKERMSSGAKAGLQSAQILKEENAMVRKRQEDFFRSLDPSLSGRHAETVYRDKKGKKVDPKLEKLKEREKEREMEEENERFMKWGRGYVHTCMRVSVECRGSPHKYTPHPLSVWQFLHLCKLTASPY